MRKNYESTKYKALHRQHEPRSQKLPTIVVKQYEVAGMAKSKTSASATNLQSSIKSARKVGNDSATQRKNESKPALAKFVNKKPNFLKDTAGSK